MLPTQQTIERSITVKAPATRVYEKLKTLEFFNRFSVWGNRDSTVINTIEGTDGMVGAQSKWVGDPGLSGKGSIRLTSLVPGQKVEQSVEFIAPKKGSANSRFTLSENNGHTAITWTFIMATPRPWNIFNLFYRLEKQVGKDFEQSLESLKQLVEKDTTGQPASDSTGFTPGSHK